MGNSQRGCLLSSEFQVILNGKASRMTVVLSRYFQDESHQFLVPSQAKDVGLCMIRLSSKSITEVITYMKFDV
jgi:hypothetical protein